MVSSSGQSTRALAPKLKKDCKNAKQTMKAGLIPTSSVINNLKINGLYKRKK